MRMTRGFLILLGLMMLLLFPPSPGWGLSVGDEAPNVRVYNPDQEEVVKLYDYLGNDVGLMWVWRDQFT